MSADTLLFQGEVNGLILSCFENERPLSGLAGLIDWRLGGELTRSIRAGGITGKEGECAYVPTRWRDRTLHLLLVGGGSYDPKAAERPRLPAESLNLLKKNLGTMKLGPMAASSRDLGGIDLAAFKKAVGPNSEVRLVE